MANRPVVVTPAIQHRFQNFVLLEPAASRMNDVDILIKGDEVREMYRNVLNSIAEDGSIKAQIIQNKLSKIGQMLELLDRNENIVISKFFDRIWRRYSYVSINAEPFLDLKTFIQLFPSYKNQIDSLLAQRLDEEDEEDMEGGGSAEVEAPTSVAADSE